MADGILGHLPPWPRQALNNSVIGMEQAYRKRKGLQLLTDADVEALKAGVPMPWEQGGAPVAAAGEATPPPAVLSGAEPPAPPSAQTPVAPAPVVVAAGVGISAEVAGWVAQGKKWSKSSIAAEQARRVRKGLPPLTEPEIIALLGEPAAAPIPAATAPAQTGVTGAPVAARPAAATAQQAAPSAAASVSRSAASTSYVGTPAVGTSKAAAAGGVAAVGPEDNAINRQRRRLVWAAVGAFLTAWFLAFFRFFLPRTLFEPATSFKIGYPEEYGLGVDTKFQQRFRIWVDRTPDRIFVIYARCTHLGCTPDWKPSENKFKCPCHGSGYDSEGINFEGPAPRPMDRAHVEIAPDGQILVDVSKLYQWPKGQPTQFNDDGAFLRA
jgi:cytochrome b6-f complex iron-sulfur subunit